MRGMDTRLDDHRLRYLHEAVRLGSVRAAADSFDVNPSVVSRQIAQLERDLGVVLVERLSRGVRATEAGALLAQRFQQWSADREDTLARLRELQGLKRGHVDIVLGEGFVSDLMSGPLDRFWRKHPGLTMSIDLAGTNEVMSAVSEDRCHIGLVFHAGPDPRIRTQTAIRQPIRCIARADHPLARRGQPVRLAELVHQPLGLMHPGYGTRQAIATAEAAAKIVLSPKLTTSSISILRHYVQSGMGLALPPVFALATDLADGVIVALPIDDPLLMATEARVITRLGRVLPDAAARLLRYLSAQMQAFRE